MLGTRASVGEASRMGGHLFLNEKVGGWSLKKADQKSGEERKCAADVTRTRRSGLYLQG